MYYDLPDLSHDPKLATALGNMVVAWANAESVLCGTMSRVSGININMALMSFYRIPTFEARRKFIQAMMLEWHPKDWNKVGIEKEIDGLSDLSLTRNDWVHGVWCSNKEKTETIIFDYRRAEGKGRKKVVKDADVSNHVEAVRKRTKALALLIKFKELSV